MSQLDQLDLEIARREGWLEGFKACSQIHCEHKNTQDVGDSDNIQVVCTDCEKVMSDPVGYPDSFLSAEEESIEEEI